MKKCIVIFIGVLFLVACTGDNFEKATVNPSGTNKQINRNSPLELNLSKGQLEEASLLLSLEKLFSDLFVEIDSKLKVYKGIYVVDVMVVLDKEKDKLYIDQIHYESEEVENQHLIIIHDSAGLAKKSSFFTEAEIWKNVNLMFWDIDFKDFCKKDIFKECSKATFKNNVAAITKFAQIAKTCFESKDCGAICKTEFCIGFYD